MMGWNYIFIGLSFILLCFLLWHEVKRTNKLRLKWRIIASILAVISLACMAVPVAFTVNRTVNSTKEVVLLTEGFNNDSVDSFLNNNAFQYPVYTIEPAVLKLAERYKPILTSLPEVFNGDGSLAAVHVFGYGLNDEQLKELKEVPLVLHPSKIPAGITNINWQRKLTAGDKLQVQGSFNNTLNSEVKLVLRGLYTGLDSIIIPANSEHTFDLVTVPKHLDRAIYNIVALQKRDTIEAEDIPVEVIPANPIKILMLSASPDFDNKFLKNRLSEKGYAVASRSRISKNIYQKEYVNISDISLDQISPAVIEKFDVLIADATELTAISKGELNVIQSAIINKGLGLIVKAIVLLVQLLFMEGLHQ